MAFWMAAVSSVTPSPAAPYVRTSISSPEPGAATAPSSSTISTSKPKALRMETSAFLRTYHAALALLLSVAGAHGDADLLHLARSQDAQGGFLADPLLFQ